MYQTMTFIILSSTIEVQNITLYDSIGTIGPCFNLVFTQYLIHTVQLARLSMGSVLLAVHSSGRLAEVHIDKIVESMPTFLVGTGSTVLSNVIIFSIVSWI